MKRRRLIPPSFFLFIEIFTYKKLSLLMDYYSFVKLENTMEYQPINQINPTAHARSGGFDWSQSWTIVRDGEVLARSTGFPCTFAGDPECPTVALPVNELRPLDVVSVRFARYGNGAYEHTHEFIVGSPSTRTHYHKASKRKTLGQRLRWFKMDKENARRKALTKRAIKCLHNLRALGVPEGNLQIHRERWVARGADASTVYENF